MSKVIHLIPYSGIGGVETAAASINPAVHEQVGFEVRSIYPQRKGWRQRSITFNPWYLYRTARHIAKESPDVLILSLWRSCVVGSIVRMLNPEIRLILMLHNSRDAHLIDRFFTRQAVQYSEQVWADSAASLSLRVNNLPVRKTRIISFLIDRLEPLPSLEVKPVFAFWGRLSAQKDVSRALRIFSAVHEKYPQARFIVIGPDGGEKANLMRQARSLEVGDAVEFAGGLSRAEVFRKVKDACFYLGTSRYEGMALSVVEAMQLGLVPVVTPVGEIANYCQQGLNALLVEQDSVTVPQLIELLENNGKYQRMRREAISAWRKVPLYRDSLLAAVCSLPGFSGWKGSAE